MVKCNVEFLAVSFFPNDHFSLAEVSLGSAYKLKIVQEVWLFTSEVPICYGIIELLFRVLLLEVPIRLIAVEYSRFLV